MPPKTKAKAAPAPAPAPAPADGPPFPADLFGPDASPALKELLALANSRPAKPAAAPAPAPAPEGPRDPFEVERYRLATKETVFMGRSCKAALQKFVQFETAARAAGANAPNDENVQRLKDQALRELRLFSVEVRKSKLQVRACEREKEDCDREEAETAARVEKSTADIERLQEELRTERARREQKEEYESLAKIILQYPSQSESKREIDRLEADVAALEAKKAAVDKACRERGVRVAMLLQLVDDLERSELEEALATELEDNRKAAAVEVEADDAAAAAAPAPAADPMDEDDDGEIVEDAEGDKPAKRARKG